MTTPLFSESQLQRLSIEAMKNQLRARLGGMVRAVKTIEAGGIIYRGVFWDRRPDLIADFSYPPPDKVSKF
jgi:hypothetical protein